MDVLVIAVLVVLGIIMAIGTYGTAMEKQRFYREENQKRRQGR